MIEHAGLITEQFVGDSLQASCICGWMAPPRDTMAESAEDLMKHLKGEQ